MKIAALNNVNRQTLAKSTIAVTTAAAAVSTTHSSQKNTQKTTYDKDFGIWGRATAEIQAAQDMAKIQSSKRMIILICFFMDQKPPSKQNHELLNH